MIRVPAQAALLLALTLAAAPAGAQTVGSKVPPYQEPLKVQPPARDSAAAAVDTAIGTDRFRPQEDVMARFAEAYAKGGKPRLAFYWNRQLAETLTQWYGDSRAVITRKTRDQAEGDLAPKQSGGRQTTVETQRRAAPGEQARPGRAETWDWEFQDGFLQPFLQSGAQVVDRTAILRIMGAGAEEIAPQTVEVMALQTMADLLVEVLVADQPQSSTGYELRARILDVKTGQILAMVNSRGLREWQKSGQAVASSKGLELPDEDDESFGPERADRRYKATASGFERTRKPPKLAAIAHNLATNTMSAMMPRLETGAAPVPASAPVPPVKAEEPKPKPPANDSAVPLPEVETRPLPAPQKQGGPSVSADEPPMPKPTRE